MANQEHVDLVKRDVNVWNTWRREHSDIRPDLSDANLSGANLSEVILYQANLSGADLSETILTWANFYQANLSGANFSGANLARADLSETDLSQADLSDATLFFANLSNAILSQANLSEAKLSNAILAWSNLSDANLFRADLLGTNFTNSNLTNANLASANLSYTIFAWVDLCHVNGLETVVHRGPSIVDVRTVTLPQGETRVRFLRGVGFPDTFIDYFPSLLTIPLQYYSLFISYAHPDEALAHRLYQDLQNKGVRCWMAPHDLRPGDYHHSRIDEAIRLHEKTLLLLSEPAVKSSWVKHEVQIALAREIAQDCTILFPLRLDDAVMHTSKDWAVQLHESRHIGDFTNWQDETAYQQAFTTLLKHLKVIKP